MWFAVFNDSPQLQAYQDITDNIATPVHSHLLTLCCVICDGVTIHLKIEFILDTVPDVQFIQAPFVSVLASDELLNGVGAVVCLPPSSLSAVSHPVDFVLQEGGVFDAKMTTVYTS